MCPLDTVCACETSTEPCRVATPPRGSGPRRRLPTVLHVTHTHSQAVWPHRRRGAKRPASFPCHRGQAIAWPRILTAGMPARALPRLKPMRGERATSPLGPVGLEGRPSPVHPQSGSS